MAIQEAELIDRRVASIDIFRLRDDDVADVMGLITADDPNEAIGINPQYLPEFILSVLMTPQGKYVFVPPEIAYQGEAQEVPGFPMWRMIFASLTQSEVRRNIGRQKVGNGTAWDQGLQIDGPDSSPEWSDLVQSLKNHAVPDPNYPKGKAPALIVPSIVYPVPRLRWALSQLGGYQRGDWEEMLALRRHESSHVAEMLLLPWPPQSDFGLTEGFPPANGAGTFRELLNQYNVTVKNEELDALIENNINGIGMMPRGYIGELQAHIGDYLWSMQRQTSRGKHWTSLAENDIHSGRVLAMLNGYKNNLFGALMAREVVEQLGVYQATQFLNDIYKKMSNPTQVLEALPIAS